MKKLNKYNLNALFLGILIPILLFLISVNATFAYFSSRAENISGEITTNVLQVAVSESDQKINTTTLTNLIKVLPGDTFSTRARIENVGSVSAYVVLEFKINVTQASQVEPEEIFSGFYTISDGETVLIEYKNGGYTNLAHFIDSPNVDFSNNYYASFDLSYNFDFYEYGNVYQGGKITYSLTAHAIQAENLSLNGQNQLLATNLLCNKLTYVRNLRIYGNTVQNGTPTPNSPVEIQSVGDKTRNLLPYPYSHKNNEETILGVTWKINEDRSVTINGTSSGYSSITLNQNTINFEAGKKYYFKCDGDYTGVVLAFSYFDENGDKQYDGNGKLWKAEYTNPTIYLQVNPNKTANCTVFPYVVEESNKDLKYEPYGYKVPVRVFKNLFNEDTVVANSYINSSGQETISANLSRTDYFRVNGEAEYILNFSTTSSANIVAFAWYDSNKTFISRSASETITGQDLEFRAIAPSNAEYAICNLINNSTDIMITTDTKTINIYLTEPLRKIGDYADYIDLTTGKVVRNVHSEYISTVTTKSSMGGTYSVFLTDISNKPLIEKTSGDTHGYAISNKFMQSEVTYSQMVSLVNNIQSYITSGGINRISYTFDNVDINTVEKAQEKIGDGFEVCYVLATPTEESINISSLSEIINAENFYIDTSLEPSKVVDEEMFI